jgi:hypothetical protein
VVGGVLWPLHTRLLGAWLLGVGSTFVMYLAVGLSRMPPRPLATTVVRALVAATVTGVLVSTWFWWRIRRWARRSAKKQEG